jgi:hypothetical protein
MAGIGAGPRGGIIGVATAGAEEEGSPAAAARMATAVCDAEERYVGCGCASAPPPVELPHVDPLALEL